VFAKAPQFSNHCFIEVELCESLAIADFTSADQLSILLAASTGDPLVASSHSGLVEPMESWGVSDMCPAHLWLRQSGLLVHTLFRVGTLERQ
jgi:hypothetical protein